jgi:hypothetical protein
MLTAIRIIFALLLVGVAIVDIYPAGFAVCVLGAAVVSTSVVAYDLAYKGMWRALARVDRLRKMGVTR